MPASWTLDEPSRSRRQAAGLLITVLLSVVMAGLVVLTNGGLLTALGLPLGAGALLLLVRYPRHAFSLLLFGTLLFEQYKIFGLSEPLTLRVRFFESFRNSLGLPLPINPIECLLALMAATLALHAVVTRRGRFERHPFQAPLLCLALMLLAFVAYGSATGGVARIALWEVRALLYMVAVYLIGSQLVRSHADVLRNTWCILIAIAIKGLQGVWRYLVELGGSIGDVPAITSHECAVFILTSFVLTAALALFGGERRMLLFALWTLPSTLMTFILSLRRVAWGGLVIGLVLLFVYLPRPQKRLVIKLALPLLACLALYFAAFWNQPAGLGLPVQQVRSVFGVDASGLEDRSNTYRDDERTNLEHTIRTFPLGRGFGQEYLTPVRLDAVDFPLWSYIPHNCVLWLWAKTGYLGMVVFLTCIALIIIQCTLDFRTTTRPLYKALLVMLIAFWIVQVMVAWYDLQLTFYRNMLYIGACMATLVPVHREARRNAARLALAESPPCP